MGWALREQGAQHLLWVSALLGAGDSGEPDLPLGAYYIENQTQQHAPAGNKRDKENQMGRWD